MYNNSKTLKVVFLDLGKSILSFRDQPVRAKSERTYELNDLSSPIDIGLPTLESRDL